jgi:hypothetical protein
MSDQSEQIKKNFLAQWIRLAFVALYVVVFALLWRFIAILVLLVFILQSLYRIFAAENNRALLTFSEGLSNFLLKVLKYVLYLSDEKPINFDDFFSASHNENKNESQSNEDVETEVSASKADRPRAENVSDDVFDDIIFNDQNDSDTDQDQQKKID